MKPDDPTANPDILQPGVQQPAPDADIGVASTSASDLPWCSKCDQVVSPHHNDPHRCPSCGTFVSGNQARKPVNEARRKHLFRKFVDEYQPQGPHYISQCEQIARVVERLDHVRPGSTDHQRLLDLQQKLADSLLAAKRPASAPDTSAITEVRRVIITPDGQEFDGDAWLARNLDIPAMTLPATAADRAPDHAGVHSGARTPEDPTISMSANPTAQKGPSAGIAETFGNPKPVCPHCGKDISHLEAGTVRFQHLLDCAARLDPEGEQRRQRETDEMLTSLRRSRGNPYDAF